jgi:hypothetical protein
MNSYSKGMVITLAALLMMTAASAASAHQRHAVGVTLVPGGVKHPYAVIRAHRHTRHCNHYHCWHRAVHLYDCRHEHRHHRHCR